MPVSGVKASRGRKPRRPPRTSTCLVVYASLGAMWPRGFHGCGAGRAGRDGDGRVMTRRPDVRSTSHERPDRTSEPAHGRDSSRRRGQRQPINVERERQASRRTERSSAHSSLLCLHPPPERSAPSTPLTRSFATPASRVVVTIDNHVHVHIDNSSVDRRRIVES